MEKTDLVKKRGHVRASLSKCVKRIHDDLSENDIDALKNILSRDLLKLEHFDQLIFDMCSAEEEDSEMEQALDYKMKFQSALSYLNTLMSKCLKEKSPSESASVVKLPKLQLPTFSGVKLEWQSFFDIFEAAIIKQPSLTDVQKFVYLKSCLTGSAKAAIEGLSLADKNFRIAIDLLKERFGSPDTLINNHLRSIQDQSCLSESVDNLRCFFDNVTLHSRCLKSLGVDPSSYERVVLPSLMSKLPYNIKLPMCDAAGGCITDFEMFLHLLGREIRKRETIAECYSSEKRNSSRNETRSAKGMDDKSSSVVALFNETNPHTSDISPAGSPTPQPQRPYVNRVTCTFCNGDHKSSWCTSLKYVDDRLDFLKKEKRCFSCMKTNHTSRICKAKRQCHKCPGKRFHHIAICPSIIQARQPEPQISQTLSTTVQTVSCDATQGNTLTHWQVMLPTAKALLMSPDGKKELVVKVVLDTGSTRSFVREDLCEHLAIPKGPEQEWNLNTFGSSETFRHASSPVDLKLKKVNSSNLLNLSAYSCEKICKAQASVNIQSFPHLKDLDLADPHDDRDKQHEVGILIGADNYYDFVFGDQIIRAEDGGLVAINSKLGWLLQGRAFPITDQTRNSLSELVMLSASSSNDLKEQLRMFWDLEHLGVLERESERAEFLPDIQLEGGRYTVSLPWKLPKSNLPLPSNFTVALKRLKRSYEQLSNDKALLREYQKILDDQIKKQIIEKVTDSDRNKFPIHYLSHRPVIRSNAKSTKVRIVFDASCRESSRSPSLNDCLLQGPCNLPQVATLLVTFRQHAIGITADIEKAFLQVKIHPDDRDLLRFLWFDSSGRLEIFRHASLVFGLTCSPAVLECVIQEHLNSVEGENPEIIDMLKRNMYVDNVVTGCQTADEAKEFFITSKQAFSSGGFNLRQWISNSKELNQFIREMTSKTLPQQQDSSNIQEDLSTASSAILNPEASLIDCETSVLGLPWSPVTDEFVISFKELPWSGDPLTKRKILQDASQFYDPLGFVSPLLITPKLMFQSLCKSKEKWDSTVSNALSKEWKKWRDEMSKFHKTIPRTYQSLNRSVTGAELHAFADASTVAYACVLFMRIEYDDGSISCPLVMSKARVAPLGGLSVPRLELLACLLLSKLVCFLRPHFQHMNVVAWSDSQTALHWISGENKIWPIFVQNRVSEIRNNLSGVEWKYVPSYQNPADLPSRGASSSTSLLSNDNWWNGPDFLRLEPRHWPLQESQEMPEVLQESSNASNIELQSEHVFLSSHEASSQPSLLNVFNLEKFSSFEKLLKVTALVLRFVKLLKREANDSNISASDIESAELMWIKQLQEREYTAELGYLRHGQPKTKLARNLNLYLDGEGRIRSKGRASAILTAATNDPVLLPRHKFLITMVINDAHTAVAHSGVSATLAKVRERFWILSGRQRVKQHIRHCHLCQRLQVLPYATKTVPELPAFRLGHIRAFASVGVDYCGPLYFRSNGEGTSVKCYICLFICASTRAVHLELTPDLSTESFIRVLKRFVSRRGVPNIISDNAKNFKAAFNRIQAVSEEEAVANYASSKRIVWKFIVERAPWMGGFYERIVKDIKLSLKKTIRKSLLKYEELETVVVEVEGILNSRPLTYVGEENEQLNLSPSHFLILQRITQNPDGQFPQAGLTLHDKLRYRQNLLNCFWDLWKNSYVLSLREKGWHDHRGSIDEPQVGDLVNLMEDKTPRFNWKVGTIVELCHGRDGYVRSAVLSVKSTRGSRTCSRLRRPIRLLIPIERCVL